MKALTHVLSLKPGEGAQIYIGNLEQEEQAAYSKSHSKEIRLRYLPQPDMEQDEESIPAKPLGTGLKRCPAQGEVRGLERETLTDPLNNSQSLEVCSNV